MFETSAWIVEIIIGVGVVVGALAYVLSKVRQVETDEIRDLAETRGQANQDLREEVEALRREVAELRGALASVQAMKTDEIATATAEKLLPFLKELANR